MKVVLYGATGMVGSGVLRECLVDPAVEQVLAIGRAPTGKSDPKLREIVLKDLTDYAAVNDELRGYDACFYCLGITSAGMSEADYLHVTYDLAVAAGRALLEHNPALVFVFVSGASTDGTEKGSVMWARVKGKTENELLRMPFKGAYMLRPGLIQPLHGVTSKTTSYRLLYAVLAPLLPLLKRIMPGRVTTTENVGRAMLRLAKEGSTQRVFETSDIEALVRAR